MGHRRREPEDTQDVVDDEDLEDLDPLDVKAVGNAWWRVISFGHPIIRLRRMWARMTTRTGRSVSPLHCIACASPPVIRASRV